MKAGLTAILMMAVLMVWAVVTEARESYRTSEALRRHHRCIPTRCSARAATCGTIQDGCGGTLECGTCTPHQACGAGGTVNVCGDDPTGSDADAPSPSQQAWPPPLPSGAAHYYVSPTGSDSASGSASTPWLTINHASNSIPNGQAVVVHVADGTYNLTNSTCIVTTVSGASASAPIIFVSDTKWGARINGQGNCEYMWWISGNAYVSVWGFDLTGPKLQADQNNGTAVILADGGGGNFDISYNRFHDVATGTGAALEISPYGDNGKYTGAPCEAHDNVFHDIAYGTAHTFGDYGIYYACGSGQLYNNLFYNMGSIGIHCWHAADHADIYNNTVWNAQGIGIFVGAGDEGYSTNAFFNVTNNIVVHSQYGIMAEANAPGTISTTSQFRNNLVYENTHDWYYGNQDTPTTLQAAGMTVTGTVTRDPLFLSPSTGDFHLSSGSPAINVGTGSGAPHHDLDGFTRPIGAGIDIGAYEHH